MVSVGADAGIAHDGDADRCLAVDADGNLLAWEREGGGGVFNPASPDEIFWVKIDTAPGSNSEFTDKSLKNCIMAHHPLCGAHDHRPRHLSGRFFRPCG